MEVDMTQEELFELAEKAGLGFIRHASEKDIEKFEQLAKLIMQHYRKATLDTIDALFDSEDPNPMYQTAYNHALIHMQEFIISMEKQ
jgi:hypothetical protein